MPNKLRLLTADSSHKRSDEHLSSLSPGPPSSPCPAQSPSCEPNSVAAQSEGKRFPKRLTALSPRRSQSSYKASPPNPAHEGLLKNPPRHSETPKRPKENRSSLSCRPTSPHRHTE